MKTTAIPSLFIKLVTALVLCWLGVPRTPAAGVSTLYSFTALDSPGAPPPLLNADGIMPSSGLVQSSVDGSFYGTTPDAGPKGAGTIFKMTPTGGLATIYSFGAVTDLFGQVEYNFSPNDLVQGTNGNFYGSTQRGSTNRNGTLFCISPSGSLTNLHVFSTNTLNASGILTNADGADPTGALVLGNDGNFYGTTQSGGINGTGTIFQLTPAGGFTTLYSFTALTVSSNADGAMPNGLALGMDGNLYGTTQEGGLTGAGTFFQVTTAGSLTPLYSFDGIGTGPASPSAPLAPGANGDFYGTSTFGGSGGVGTIFEVTPSGMMTVHYSFQGGNDGELPGVALTLASDGNFYGTSAGAGANGDGTIFKITPTGTFSALYSFSALNDNEENSDGAAPSAALLSGKDGNLYGTCTAGGANGSGTVFRFTVAASAPSNLSPTITKQPPAKVSGLAGASITLTVTAKGAGLTYQWSKNGGKLGDGGDIANSGTSGLVVGPLLAGDAGTYSVVITNTFGAVTSAVSVLTVALDTVLPTVAISSPTANLRTATPVLKGTASDNIRTTNVVYWVTNINNGVNGGLPTVIGGNATLALGAGAASNWSVATTLFPGTNILAVQSVNFSGNSSRKATVGFFYKVTNALSLIRTGDGSGAFTGTAAIHGDALPTNDGAWLNVGEGYTVTAVPDKFSLFSNWVNGVVVTTNPTLKFTMEPGLALQANFTTNLFLGMAGTYYGLFTNQDGVAEATWGMLTGLKISTQGSYSGKLLIDGASYSFTGSFDKSGQASYTNLHSVVGPLVVQMALNWNVTPRQVLGSVSGTNWTNNLVADLASVNFGSGQYTALLNPPAPLPLNFPPGDGYLLLTNHAGLATVTGALADGTALTESVGVSETGDVPVYCSLYANTGLVLGWINLTNGSSAGNLAWIKKAAKSPLLYTNGVTNMLSAQDSVWTNLGTKVPAIALPAGMLDISGGFLAAPLAFNVGVSNNSALAKLPGSPANSLTGSINPKTGLLSVTYGNGNGKATTKGAGAALQNQTIAGGFFLGTTNAGSITLQPPP